ncbi:GNAT family N-acetyltransferase [Halobacillus rhizosphaerae]|uniref:GNAT family N-acetyltransferase n=1 Tax=Halobacillus rhizosphaerae TaxID=3064889 RepID=UPI00398AAD83
MGSLVETRRERYRGLFFYIAELCINNDIQRKGWGSMLLESLEEQLSEDKVSSIYLPTSNGGLAERFFISFAIGLKVKVNTIRI